MAAKVVQVGDMEGERQRFSHSPIGFFGDNGEKVGALPREEHAVF